jgi:hypothetical protein
MAMPPLPTSADGLGDSLQRRRPHEYGNDPMNWKGLAPTPGRANVAGTGFTDTDADGMPDSYETANSFLFNNAADAAQDADGDGRTNYEEFLDGTGPRNGADSLSPPSITTPPQNQALAAGAAATFSVTATGTPPLFYQWRFTTLPRRRHERDADPGGGPDVEAGEYAAVVRNAAALPSVRALSDGEPATDDPGAAAEQHCGSRHDCGVQRFRSRTGPIRYNGGSTAQTSTTRPTPP